MTKVKLFKDASQGYINLYDRYVTHLIDTFEMQRLKDVAQTGMRPIFSGATHDRFSHSLGVFNNAVMMYDAFSSNLVAGISDEDPRFVEAVKNRLRIYKEYYLIACVLHDIGHPAYSHTYEYLYNDNTVLLEDLKGNGPVWDIDNITIKIDSKELDRIVKLLGKSPEKESELQKKLSKSIKDFYNNLKQSTEESWGYYCHPDTLVDASTISGQPHEMMGAYQILRSGKIQEAIKRTFRDFFSEHENEEIKEQAGQLIDFAFVACMLIGAKYINVGHRNEDINNDSVKCCIWDASLRNCIIELLNGLMDADSMDYLNRNSHFAGYSTSTLDVTRLTNAFSAFYDSEKGIFISCLEKSALSVMEGFIQARNFEPKWLYSHHKIVYCSEFLFKYLFKKCSRYIFARDEEKWNKLIFEHYQNLICNNPIIRLYIQKHGGTLPATVNSLKIERDLLRETISNLATTSLPRPVSGAEIIAYLETKPDEEDNSFVSKIGKQLLDKVAELSDSFNLTGEVENLCARLLELVKEEAEEVSGSTDERALDDFFQLVSSTISYVDEIDNLLAKIKNAYLGYIISPVARFEQNAVNGDIYYKATDPDIASLFKKAYLRYGSLSYNELDFAEQRIGQEWEYPFFQDALKEFQTHEYRQSLWKSVEEYTLFLNQISLSTGLSKDTVSDFLVKKLIPEGGKIDFEDPDATYRTKNKYEINGIFINSVNCTKDFEKVFRIFGNGLVIRITSQKFKSFNKLRIHFGNDILCGKGNNGIVNYSDISNQKVPPKKWIPYIYYKFDDLEDEVSQQFGKEIWGNFSYSEQKSKVRKYLLENLKKSVEGIIVNRMKIDVRVYNGKMLFSKGNIIRDPVHGDIMIPQKFMDIIDTRVFQRLRGIKQLATAEYVFPDAGHTRFSHSVGTFYVMRLILERFTSLFGYLGIQYTEEEFDAALAAALLHDVGHGPYSHVFEHIFGKWGDNKKNHEEWTKEIIEQDQELQLVFKKNWNDTFYLKVLDCLRNESGNPHELKLKEMYASLISSQLDADRIDYLMRDSYHTGVNFGSFDLQRLISSMLLTESNGKIRVCFDESAVPIIEQFITGRYNMYSEVYYSPYKVFSEELICKITSRFIKEPNLLGNDSVLRKILEGSISLEQYLKLDDRAFIREIEKCVESSQDHILNEMIDNLSYRKGFKRLHVLDDSFKSTFNFMQDFEETFGTPLEDFYGIICKKLHFNAYFTGELPNDNIRNVLISQKNAGLTAFENISRIFSGDGKEKTNELWETNRIYLYYSSGILNNEWKMRSLPICEKSFISFIEQYNIRNHTEIENKYWCEKNDLVKCEEILRSIVDGANRNFEDYNADAPKEMLELHDEYYDTNDFKIFNEGMAIRLRSQKGMNTIVTVKKSGISDIGYDNGQFIRSEYEFGTEKTDIRDAIIESFIKKSVRNMDDNNSGFDIDFDQLRKKIEIDNSRKVFTIERKESEFKCVVSLDSIKYKDTGSEQVSKDYQIEIELSSPNPMERIELRYFSEKLIREAGITCSEAEESKYGKALKSFNLL